MKLLMVQLESSPGATPSDAVPEVISDERCRRTLAVLRETDQPLALADLAGDLVREERGDDAGEPDYEAIRRCRLMLHHKEVPKLVEAGLVRYDSRTQTLDVRDEAFPETGPGIDESEDAR